MNKKVTVRPRWSGPVPTKNDKPLPVNQWTRAGRKRKWTVRWYAPDGTRPRQTFDTKDEAETFARQKTAEFEHQGPQARVRPKDVSLGDFVDEFVRLRAGPSGRRLSDGTMLAMKPALTRFCETVGAGTLLGDVTRADVARFIAALRNNGSNPRGGVLSPATVNKTITSLKAAFGVARQLGYIRQTPFDGVRLQKVADKAVRYVTPAEFRCLLEAAGRSGDGLWWQVLIALSYTAGCRLNEAVNLVWADIDFEADTVRIIAKRAAGEVQAWQPKDTDSRVVPIPQFTIDLLTRLQHVSEEGNPYVLISKSRLAVIRAAKRAGTWVENGQTVNNLRRKWLTIVKAAGIPHATIHDLRRGAITNWARDLPIHVVRELAGHTDIATTQQYYLSVTEADLSKAREVTANVLQLDPKQTQNGPNRSMTW